MPLSESISFSRPLKQAILCGNYSSNDLVDEFEEPSIEKLQLQHASELKKAAEEAYQRGIQDGKKAASGEIETQQQTLAAQVHKVLTSVENERDQVLDEMTKLIPELVIESVGRLLYDWKPDKVMVSRIVEHILEDFDSDEKQMRLFLNSADLESLTEQRPKLADEYPGLRVTSREELHPGECILEGRFGVSDARHSTKLSSLRKVLER